jgi:hypothetical protein
MGDVSSGTVLAILFTLTIRIVVKAFKSAKLPCLLLGHCNVLRMRAGALVTTRELRNGRLANTILSVDSAVYHCR